MRKVSLNFIIDNLTELVGIIHAAECQGQAWKFMMASCNIVVS